MSVQNQIDRINQNVANTYAVLSALGANMPAEQTSDNLAATAGTAKVVLYSEQTLTEDQQAQARENIGIVGTGEDGQRGTGVLKITTATTSASGTGVNGVDIKYKLALSTVKSEAGVTEVLVGDAVLRSYYVYPVVKVDNDYVYMGAYTSIRGSTGADGVDGKTAYQYAQDGGYTGTETEFADKLAKEYTINPLRGKKVSFLGDSICAGDSTTHLGGYGKIIADRNGMVYENVAHGGATVTAETYSRTTGDPKPWLCRMVANMSSDADYAIIEGGINDGWDETVKGKIGAITKGYDATLDDTTYYGAFESMLKQLVTKFQGKKIGYIAVPKIHSLYDSSQNAPNFYHIALECCAKWGVSVCDLNTITPPVEYLRDLGTTYTADGTHPTYEGYLKYYCDPIEAWMQTLTTSGSLQTGTLPADLDDKYVSKNDISIKKAQLTLDDGTTVLIDVVVASAGTTINKWINLVPESVDAAGAVYNGTGYKKDYRLSSTGVEKSQSGCIATGYIPAVGGDVVRMAGALPWYQSNYNTNYLCAYDSDFNFVGAVYNSVGDYFYTKNIAADYELGDVCEITLASGMNIAYVRASWPGFTAQQVNSAADLIVTVNQEIT